MAEEPTCDLPNGSSISFRFCRSRMSLANLDADWAMPLSVDKTCQSILRG